MCRIIMGDYFMPMKLRTLAERVRCMIGALESGREVSFAVMGLAEDLLFGERY